MTDQSTKASRNNGNDESGNLIVLLFQLPAYVIRCFFWPLKSVLLPAARLDAVAVRYRHWELLLAPIKYLAFFVCLISLIYAGFVAPSATPWFYHYAAMLTAVSIALASGLGYSVLFWIGRRHAEPEIQRRIAGIEAEAYVQRQIDGLQAAYPGSRAVHGALLVFNAGEEFSVEIDHLLILKHNCYLIETKYRNATVSAMPDAAEWKTATADGRQGTMRNALAQAKNTARVLEKQFTLPFKIIPLVAIHGTETRVVDGPANVARSDSLGSVIAAFEDVETSHVLDPVDLIARLMICRKHDDASLQRHVQRANVAKRRAEARALVGRTSR